MPPGSDERGKVRTKTAARATDVSSCEVGEMASSVRTLGDCVDEEQRRKRGMSAGRGTSIFGLDLMVPIYDTIHIYS